LQSQRIKIFKFFSSIFLSNQKSRYEYPEAGLVLVAQVEEAEAAAEPLQFAVYVALLRPGAPYDGYPCEAHIKNNVLSRINKYC